MHKHAYKYIDVCIDVCIDVYIDVCIAIYSRFCGYNNVDT